MKHYFFLFFSFLALSLQAQNQSFSLEQAIAYALDQSTTTRKAEVDVQYAKAQVREYQAIGIPKVNGSLQYQRFFDIPTQILPDFISPIVVGTMEQFQLVPAGTAAGLPQGFTPAQFGTNNNFTASITASTLIFDGSYLVGLKAAKGLEQMTRRQADLSLYELRYQVKKAYFTVLLAEQNADFLDKNLANLSKLLAETQAFKDNGLVEQLDVDRLALTRSNLQAEREIIQRQVDLAYNALKFQMNFPLEQSLELSDKLPQLLQAPAESDLQGETPFGNRIELDILQRTEYLNELNIKRLYAGYYPNMTAFFTHQQVLQRNKLFDKDEAGFFPTTIGGITLNVPIFDGLDKSAKIQIAKLDKQRFTLQIEDFKRGMSLQVQNARTAYRNAAQRLQTQEQNLALAERILNTTKVKYKEGFGSSLEITQAEQELYRTQANYLNALYDLVLAKTDLDKALGK